MNTKLDTLTVGQCVWDMTALGRCFTGHHPTNVVEIRLTTRGLEVETTSDEDLTDRIKTLERELEESEDSYNSADRERDELSDERDKLLENVWTLELKVKELEKELSSLNASKMPQETPAIQ